MELSAPQQRILDYLRQCDRRGKLMPSIRELMPVTGLKSTSNIRWHLIELESKGYIKRHDGIARGIRLVRQPGDHTRFMVTVEGDVDERKISRQIRDLLEVQGLEATVERE